MKIDHETPFPTVGEVVQTVFRWTGFWDYAVAQAQDNETSRKELRKLQKELQRQVSEEYLPTFDKLGDFVSRSLYNALHDNELCAIIGDSFYLLLVGYIREVNDNATWMDRKETARWYLSACALLPFMVTFQRFSLMGCLGKELYKLVLPDDEFWYLPSRDKKKKWLTPVQKTVRWWMKANGFSSAEQLERRIAKPGLVSAVTIRSWICDNEDNRSIPELSTLRILADTDLHLGPDEQAKKNSLLAMILVCRLVQGFCDMVQTVLGKNEAVRLLRDYRILCRAFEKYEKNEFVQFMNLVAAKAGLPMHELPFQIVMKAKDNYLSKVIMDRAIRSIEESKKRGTSCFVKEKNFVSEQARIFWRRNNSDGNKSIEIKRSQIQDLVNRTRLPGCLMISDNTIKQLEEAYRALPPGVKANYMMKTVRARQAVCLGDCETAFTLYVEAFQEARYCGGQLVKIICEELMALCCFCHKMACKNQEPRGDYWKVAKYLREWCDLMLISPGFSDKDDDVYIEKGRRFFMRLMGNPESR